MTEGGLVPAEPLIRRPTAVVVREKAVEMFYDRGFEGTSLRSLAEAVGIQVASLYNHISSKEDLLHEIMTGIMQQLLEETEEAADAALPPERRLLLFMDASIRLHATQRLTAQIGNSELRSLSGRRRDEVVDLRERYQSRLEQILLACRDSGRISVPDVKMAGFAAFGMLLHVAVWYRPDGSSSLDDVVAGLLAAYAPTAQALTMGGARTGS